jgi:hydroxymethylpyrimidine/phosphomethylpyrimidine kinase
MLPAALTIAGSDPSGGAGIQADLKTFHAFGVYGQAVVTLVTVQNSLRVSRVEGLPADLVAEQIGAVLEDAPPAAIKTGALGSVEVIRAVAQAISNWHSPLVVDPVLFSTHGAPLAEGPAGFHELIPRAALITPNLFEAVALTSHEDPREAARALCGMGAGAVLVKGGHLPGDAVDLYFDGRSFREFRSPRIETRHTHGTGCTYSAAIAAGLALGMPMEDAIARAKRFIEAAIRTNPGLGRGAGPLNHLVEA